MEVHVALHKWVVRVHGGGLQSNSATSLSAPSSASMLPEVTYSDIRVATWGPRCWLECMMQELDFQRVHGMVVHERSDSWLDDDDRTPVEYI